MKREVRYVFFLFYFSCFFDRKTETGKINLKTKENRLGAMCYSRDIDFFYLIERIKGQRRLVVVQCCGPQEKKM